MSLRRYRRPALLLLVLHLQACSTWRPSPVSITEAMQDEPAAIRVTTVDGTVRTLDDPRLWRDSLTTEASMVYCPRDRAEPCPATGGDGESLAPIPLDQITSVEVRQFSTGRTLGAVALTGVVAFGVVFLIACSDDNNFIC